MRRLGTPLGLLAVALALATVGAPAAGATPRKAAGVAGARITLLGQPAFTTVRNDVTMKVRIDGDPNRLSVQAAIHNPIGTRSGFDDSLQGRTTKPSKYFPLTKVSAMTGTAGIYDMSVSGPNSSGVFPLDVTLYENGPNGSRLDGFTTYVVSATGPDPTGYKQLRVTWIWPFTANPAYLANGTPDPAVVRELRPGGRLNRIATLLDSTEAAVTLAPNPETIESLSSLAEDDPQLAGTLGALRHGTKAAIAGSYVPIDVPSLVSAGIHTEIGTQLAVGTRALTAAGITPDRTVMMSPLDRAGLNQLAALGVDRLVVDPSQLQPNVSNFTQARLFQLQADPHNVTAAEVDPALTGLLLQPDVSPVLRAQRFVAALAVVQREQPGITRGVVVAMPNRWGDDPSVLEAASIAATALRANPFVTVVGAGTFFDTVSADTKPRTTRTPLVRQVNDSVRTTSPAVSAGELRDKRTRLDAFRGLVAADDPRIKRGERALLVAMSSVWTGTQGRKRAAQELGVIEASISQYVHLIRRPQQTTITITARRAAIPISFQNGSAQPITVRVKLSSEKLFFPQGAEHLITLAPHNTTTRFAVETRASGTFPLIVTLSSADGGIVFQQTRFTVRSTVVSGVGLFLMLGAGVFLAGWWGNHYRRRRRNRRQARSSGNVPVVPRSPDVLQPVAPGSGSVR